MRYTDHQVDSQLLDQPIFTGDPRNPINMRQIAPRLGLRDSMSKLKWRPRSPWDRVRYSRAAKARRAEEDFLAEYLGVLVPRRCQMGVFAAKIHFEQYLKVFANPVGHRMLGDSLFIHISREDLLAQAVSIHFANLTGRWDIDDSVLTTPAAQPNFFDPATIDRITVDLAEQDSGWRIFLARSSRFRMSISYEQLCQDPLGFVSSVARRIGIDPATLRQGYTEAGAMLQDDPGLPSKREVAQHYLDSQLQFKPGFPR
jgi:LPS sulfotransferase NodH